MKVTNKIKIYLDDKHLVPPIDVMQGDTNTRVLEFSLYEGGSEWPVPAGASVAVAYRRADGRKGIYDTLADGSVAYTVAGNVVTVTLVPQALAVPGNTAATVVFTDTSGGQLATCCVILRVERNPAIGAVEPEDYYNLRQMIAAEVESLLDGVSVTGGGGKNYVTKYGAKGNGVTDDTAAFNNALAINRTVFVPGGTYVLSDELTVRENCCLELAQDAVLKFTQTDKNCITLLRLAYLKGNHATIIVPYAFKEKVLNADTVDDEAVLDSESLAASNAIAVPPFKKWDPQWKMSRYITDINICKPNANGFHYSDDGACYGTAVYMGCSEGIADFMWGVNISGLRISGGFTYGIRMCSGGETWNHDARIEAVIECCETGASVENCKYARLAVTIQPRPAANGAAYAKYGVKLVGSKGTDLSSSRVWDWNATNTLWTEDGEYQHIAMYGQCRGLILDDFMFYEESRHDIRSLIYTDTASNLEQMTVLQEPFTRWFKPVNGEPYFSDGYAEKKLVAQEELDRYFNVDVVKGFTDALATAIDTDGSVYNGNGYIIGRRMETDGTEVDSAYYALTGFIPCKKNDVIHVHDMSFTEGDQNCRVQFFDAAFNRVTYANSEAPVLINRENLLANSNTYVADYEATDNGFKLTLSGNVVHDTTAYARFVFYKTQLGRNPMIAINEEIKYSVEGFLSDGVKVKAENVIGGVNVAAEVGQTVVVKSVDDNGIPTGWEAVSLDTKIDERIRALGLIE